MDIPKDLQHKMEMTVSANDTAAKYGSGLIEVFATPAMIGFMESTAQLLVQPYLPEGMITLGIEVNIKHMKATPVGMKVECIAKLQEVDGKKLTFFIEAFDEQGKIGEGSHIRYIVNAERFMQKLNEAN